MTRRHLPTRKQTDLYYKLRKHGAAVNLATELMYHPSLAKKVLRIKNR